MMPATGAALFSVPDVPVGDGNFDVFGINILSRLEYECLMATRG
jgi:hypothetical protein